MSTGARDARLDFHRPAVLEEVIQEAAASLGRSVSDFAVGTLVQQARSVIEQRSVITPSGRDRVRFIAILGDTAAGPKSEFAKAVGGTRRTSAEPRIDERSIERPGVDHDRS